MQNSEYNDPDRPFEKGERPDAAIKVKVGKLIDLYGTACAARMLGVTRETVARAAGGLPLYATSIRKIVRYFGQGR